MKHNGSKFPFFIVIDDGGFEDAVSDFVSPISMETYAQIASLAKSYDMCITLCITACFLDQNRVSGAIARPLPYVAELVAFLKENGQHIEIAYHGLTHEYEGHAGEYFCLDNGCPVPEAVQRQYIDLSRQIFALWELDFPSIFVPPYNAWEEGVTDRLAHEFGMKWLIGYERLRFAGRSYRWGGSQHLEFLPRTGMGLSGGDISPYPETPRRISFYPCKTLLNFSLDHIRPQRLPARLRISRAICDKPVHSYMTHIGNYFPGSLDFWHRLFDAVLADDRFHFCRSHLEAVTVYKRCLESK